jgi:hypothetical protein
MIKLSEDEILVKSIRKLGKLTDFVDSIKIEVNNFEETHALRNVIYG